jgi:hypothetical protein
MLEAQLTGQTTVEQRRLSHHQADQIVGEQIDPNFLHLHGRGLAPQLLHAQGGLDVAQIKLNMPAIPIQPFNGILGRLLWTQQRGDQCLTAGTQFAHGHTRRCLCVILWRHPVRLDRWFG